MSSSLYEWKNRERKKDEGDNNECLKHNNI